MADFLDEFIKELLHLDDVRSNRLLHVGDGNSKAYKLFSEKGASAEKMLSAIKRSIGKVSNRTVLKDSAQVRTGVDNPNVEKWLWHDLTGLTDSKALDKFITEAYSVINLKGNNPLFLGLGALKWEIAVSDEMRTVVSPLLIFPIKLIRGTPTSAVEIEFVDDEAYFNPVLAEKMTRTLTDFVTQKFPRPNGAMTDLDEPIDLEKLTPDYFDAVEDHIKNCASEKGVFEFERDGIYIAQYNHSDMCMYYDVKRNRKKIEEHPLIRRIFGGQSELPALDENCGEPRFVLAKDSVQEDVIREILQGQSLIIKGPPGTGKTLTIANMIAALLHKGKKVIFASKKLAALAEVNAKLPERLRKFAMLLDFETEQKAAAVNPAEVKKNFKELLRYVSEYHFNDSISASYESAMREQSSAVLDLNAYFKDVFSTNYYDCIDTYFKSDLPAVEFASPETVVNISRTDYGTLLSRVEEAGKHFETLSVGGNAVENPWFGIGNADDTEGAFAENSHICGGIEKVLKGLSAIDLHAFPSVALGDIYEAADNKLEREDGIKILTSTPLLRSGVDVALTALKEAREQDPEFGFSFTDGGSEECFKDLEKCGVDTSLTYAELKLLSENASLFVMGGRLVPPRSTFDKMCDAADKIAELEKEAVKKELEVNLVLDKLQESDWELALKHYPKFEAYVGSDAAKPKMFDFGALGAYKKLCAYSSRKPSFKDITGAISSLKRVEECRGDIIVLKNLIATTFGNKLHEDGFKFVYLVAAKCRKNVEEYLTKAYSGGNLLKSCLAFSTVPEKFTVDEFIKSRKAYTALIELKKKCEEVAKLAEVEIVGDIEAFANSVALILRLNGGGSFKNATEIADFIQTVSSLDSSFRDTVYDLAKQLLSFRNKYYETAYTKNPWAVKISQLDRFLEQSQDRSQLNAALNYDKLKNDTNILNISTFFETIEKGDVFVTCDMFGELFEHSFYKLILDYMLALLGKRRNGLGKNAALNLEKFERAEEEILKCNAQIIEKLCLSRIDTKDPDFKFLDADRGVPKSLRYIFKTNADAILKLKPCIILSPSTASVLMRPEEYFDFDVAIIDEASQLEPVNLLPVLVRAKQCVLVGDEFQMPPLTHFKVKNSQRIDDPDSELTIDTDISALSLALHSSAFETKELACHYRSNTESLIAFSQKEFYPYMRTFPSAQPFKEGLGFEDVYVENGSCDNGVNAVEARKVVEKLADHFKKYYNEEKGTLQRSVGVVAFGEAQLKYIVNLVERDDVLNNKIRTALSNYDDLPDKLVFFRTIESVQGQETDSLILSLTYGRDKDGKLKLAFGELNRDALGKNIFNVAVTRAQSKITVVHSVKANELGGNERIAFIKDYLYLVEQFSKGGKSQFVSTVPEYGRHFFESVAAFLKESGIAEERIVFNYGVTEGSVRIPVAVLSKDLQSAEIGIWCEIPVHNKYDFLDYNVRYFRSLVNRGWNLHRVFIHEWFDNAKYEKAELLKAIKPFI